MYDLIANLVTTLLGVVIGGLIAIKSSNVANAKLLRKEHTLALLQKIKELLNNWSLHLLTDGTDVLECGAVSNAKGYTASPDLAAATAYFNTNISVLKTFQPSFHALHKESLRLQLEAVSLKKSLAALAEKHGTQDPLELYDTPDGAAPIDAYAEKLFALHDKINQLVAEIDRYIDRELLK